MLLTEFTVSQCSGRVPILSPVAAALLSNKLKSTSSIRLKSQSNCRFLAHPLPAKSFACWLWSGVGLVTAALSPSPPNGVPFWREYLAVWMDCQTRKELHSGVRRVLGHYRAPGLNSMSSMGFSSNQLTRLIVEAEQRVAEQIGGSVDTFYLIVQSLA
jgi:hypothetical protein